MNKSMPDQAEEKVTPTPSRKQKKTPEEAPLDKDIPKEKSLKAELPPVVNPENVITIGGEQREIKPTKLKYQRNRTAAAYRILDEYPLTDILAVSEGVLDPERDGDAIVFDFLIAVFDDAAFVTNHYDEMTSEDVDRAVKIFKRLNRIDEKEEAAKNRAAKETNR